MIDVSQLLLAAGEKLSPAARRLILALGPDAVEPLLELLHYPPGQLRGGYAPLHAVRLLGELGTARAVEPLLAILQRAPDDLLIDAVVLALPKLGAAMLAPALRVYAASADPELRSLLASALAELRVRDERIFQALLEQLGYSPWLGAGSLTVYGDPRALGPLAKSFDALQVDLTDWFSCEECMEFAHAVSSLGGDLTKAQSDKLDAALQARRFLAFRRNAS